MAPTKAIVFLAGSRWEDVQGTDHQLARSLSKSIPILWVDPPLPLHLAVRGPDTLKRPTGCSSVAPGITRLRVMSMPGFTRRPIAPTARFLMKTAIRRTLQKLHITPLATLVLSPLALFPAGLPGARILYVTDDWVAGAPLMGLDRGLVRRTLGCNLRAAHSTVAVSPGLAENLDQLRPARVKKTTVLPNGCHIPVPGGEAGNRTPTAVLAGQLNERLDLSLLEALQASGTQLLVIGPRTERDLETGKRLDAFLAANNVSWLGKLPYADMQAHLGSARVGLTPYRDTPFNRAAFPLKTLDYLASGLPVVATDLPSVRWLDTDLVSISSGPSQFVDQVRQILQADPHAYPPARYRDFAKRHTWDERAAQLIRNIEGISEHANHTD